jgi:hypothetical protein
MKMIKYIVFQKIKNTNDNGKNFIDPARISG